MSFAPEQRLDDETRGWLKHIAWTAAGAALSAVLTKCVDLVFDEIKARRAKAAKEKS